MKLSNSWAKKRPNYNWRGVYGVAVLTSIAAAQFVSGYTPLAKNFHWPSLTGREAAQQQALAIIPQNASVSAESRLAGHLAQRSTLRFFPDMRQADWVIVDAWSGHYPFYQPITGTTKTWQSLLSDPGWETAYAKDGLIVLRRGNGPPQAIIEAFRPPLGSELTPQKVHFGDENRGVDLIGLARLRITPGIMAICSDWQVLETGALQPLLGFTYGSFSQAAEPLVGTSFLPSLFSQPGIIRDCTTLNTPIGNKPVDVSLMVVEGNNRLSAALNSNIDDSASNIVEGSIFRVRLQP